MKSPIKKITTPEELARILKEHVDAEEVVFIDKTVPHVSNQDGSLDLFMQITWRLHHYTYPGKDTSEDLALFFHEFLKQLSQRIFYGEKQSLSKEYQLRFQEHEREIKEIQKDFALQIKSLKRKHQNKLLSLPLVKRKRK